MDLTRAEAWELPQYEQASCITSRSECNVSIFDDIACKYITKYISSISNIQNKTPEM